MWAVEYVVWSGNAGFSIKSYRNTSSYEPRASIHTKRQSKTTQLVGKVSLWFPSAWCGVESLLGASIQIKRAVCSIRPLTRNILGMIFVSHMLWISFLCFANMLRFAVCLRPTRFCGGRILKTIYAIWNASSNVKCVFDSGKYHVFILIWVLLK